MAKVIAEQANLYISDTIIDGIHHRYYYDAVTDTWIDNRITEVVYGQNFSIVVSGGSGTGQLHYSLENITGTGTINQSGVFQYTTPGTVWVKIYKDGSSFSRYSDTGNPVNGYYQQSKTLVIELKLEKKTIKIRTIPVELSIQMGASIPSIQRLGVTTQVSGLVGSDSLRTNPQIYFVYDSDDFYRFDVLGRAYSESLYQNGVRFSKNNDGSWGAVGTATADTFYPLITSPYSLPNYIVKGRKYDFILRGGNIPIKITWYKKDQSYEIAMIRNSEEYTIPSDATGVLMQFYVASGSTVNQTLYYNMIDLEYRAMTTRIESQYPVSARNAVAPNKPGYNQKIQYRSTKLKVENTAWYSIIPRCYMKTNYSGSGSVSQYSSGNEKMGSMSTSHSYAKPLTKITIQVKALAGVYYRDTDTTTQTYTIDYATPKTEFDTLWPEGTEVSLGSEMFYIQASNGNKVPFSTISHTPVDDSSADRLVSGTYETMMPVSDIVITCQLSYIGTFWESTGADPYDDVGPRRLGSSKAVQLADEDYWDALLFCYYARQKYFSEGTTVADPLMQGYGNRQFYRKDENDLIDHRILRRELVTVMTRLSHTLKASDIPPEYDRYHYPITRVKMIEEDKNFPEAILYTYGGFSPYFVEDGENVIGYTDVKEMFPSGAYRYEASVGSWGTSQEYWMANDDYLASMQSVPEITWGTWMGVMNGFTAYSFLPNTPATFEECATVLWRYAMFRQMDVRGRNNYDEIDDTSASEWAQNGPIKWAISNGLIKTEKFQYYEDGHLVNPYPSGVKPSSQIDRAQFAYMIMRFCMMYAW